MNTVLTGSLKVAGTLLLLATVARAQTPVAAHPGLVETIDKFCDGLRPMTKAKKGRRLFGLFRKDERDEGRWIEYAREDELKASVKGDASVYDVTQVWSRADGATAVSMSLTSGSGDWVHLVDYCFRPDGTLARVDSVLNTFNVVDKADPDKDVKGATRERIRHFDGSGAPIKVTRRVLDLQTKRPAPTLQVMDDEEPIYKNTAALPFHQLLEKSVGRKDAR